MPQVSRTNIQHIHTHISYWKRVPTGKEWVVQSILGINHGGLGVVPWNDPTTPEIKDSATGLAKALPEMKQFILDPGARRVNRKVNRVDVALWEVEKGKGKGEGKEVLLVATNLNYEGAVVELKEPLL